MDFTQSKSVLLISELIFMLEQATAGQNPSCAIFVRPKYIYQENKHTEKPTNSYSTDVF